MTSFSSIPPLNLLNAPSTQCNFQSVVFIRSLLTAMKEKNFVAVHCGFDKALQLSLTNSSSGTTTSNSAAAAAASPLSQQQQQHHHPTSPAVGAPSPVRGRTGSFALHNTANATTTLGATTTGKKQQSTAATIKSNNQTVLGSTTTTQQHQNQQQSNTKAMTTGLFQDEDEDDEDFFSLTSVADSSCSNQQQQSSSSSSSHSPSLAALQQRHQLSGKSITGRKSKSSMVENLSLLTSSHPLLSMYADWLYFCIVHEFSVLQTQHCMLLLNSLLRSLNAASPASCSNNTEESTTSKDDAKEEREKQQEGKHQQQSDASSSFFTSNPPQKAITTLTNFLADSCRRRHVLVIDEDKVRQAALEKKRAEEAAAKEKIAQQQALELQQQNEGKKRGTGGGASKSQRGANPASNKNANKNTTSGADEQNATSAGQSTTTPRGLLLAGNETSARTTSSQLQQQQQQQLLVVDPNPHVKQITVDPVFSPSEVRAICQFVHETIFQHWRLVAVLLQAPDGLKLPIHHELVVETLPISFPALQAEGTPQKIYLDTLARLQMLEQASQTIENCFTEAMEERKITIRPEYDRSTSVALRRDKAMREEDTRKQMRGDEFKRTVKVLGRVMEQDIVMKQLAANPVALNKEDEATAHLSAETEEQIREYKEYLLELQQEQGSLASASPGSTLSNAAHLVGSVNRNSNNNNSKQQQQQRGSPSSTSAKNKSQQNQSMSGNASSAIIDEGSVNTSGTTMAASSSSSSPQAPQALTLDQRLERLEQAVLLANSAAGGSSPNDKSQNSPGGRRHR